MIHGHVIRQETAAFRIFMVPSFSLLSEYALCYRRMRVATRLAGADSSDVDLAGTRMAKQRLDALLYLPNIVQELGAAS